MQASAGRGAFVFAENEVRNEVTGRRRRVAGDARAQSPVIHMKNTTTQTLVQELRKTAIDQQAPLWKRVAEDLERPTRQRRVVNIFKIDAYSQDGDILIVPGKVLGEGDLTKKVTVVALSFSEQALSKINKNGKTMTIPELVKANPKASKVKILG
jgi:large subunit ribosomal protein L18e